MKVWRKTEHYVWCDSHCEIHTAQYDVYTEGDLECQPANWRPVAIQTDDPNEQF